MKMWREAKRIVCVLMACILMTAAAGCGRDAGNTETTKAAEGNMGTAASSGEKETQDTKSDEQYTITYWHHDASENIVKPLEKIIADFEAENPNIKVDFLALPADSFYQKYVTAVATGTAPDIFGVRDGELLALVNQDALLPLDDYIGQWEQKENIPDNIWNSVISFTPDGKTYMIPSYMNACIMWYNTKLMKEKGVEIPGTLDEFLADCEQYADPASGSYFYTLRGGAGCYDNLFIFMMSYAGGNGFFDEDGKCVLDQELYVEAMEKYAGIYKNGWTSRDCITNGYKEMVAEFGSGTAMCLSHNSTSASTHRDNLGEGNFTNAIHPAGKTGKTAIPVPSIIGAAVTTQCEHPEIAARFVEYLAEHQSASYFCEQAGKTPVNDLAYEDDWCKNDPYMPLYSELMADPDVVLYNNPIWLPEWTDMINGTITSDFQAVLMGEKDCREVLEAWAAELTGYQQNYMAGQK